MWTRARLYAVVGVASGVAAHLLCASIPLSLAIGLVAPILLAAAPRFLVATLRGAFTLSPRVATAASSMSGTEFEDYVARIARSCGVPVIMTPSPATGAST